MNLQICCSSGLSDSLEDRFMQMQKDQVKKAVKPLKEEVPRIKGDAAVGVMKHKDGTVEIRKLN